MFDGLFEFDNVDDLEKMIEGMDTKTAIKIIEIAIVYAQQNGLYSLPESHCIYKCLKKVKENNI